MPIVRKTLKDLSPIPQSRIDELEAMDESTIDYSDIPELDADFWENAELHGPVENKEAVSLRLDPEVLEWFKTHGKGHTTRMAAVLRQFYEHHRKTAPYPRHDAQ